MNALLLKFIAPLPTACKFAIADMTGRMRASNCQFVGVIPQNDRRRALVSEVNTNKIRAWSPDYYEAGLRSIAASRLGYELYTLGGVTVYYKQVGNRSVYHYRTTLLGKDTYIPCFRQKDKIGSMIHDCVSIRHQIEMKLSTMLYGTDYSEFHRLMGWDWTFTDELKQRFLY